MKLKLYGSYTSPYVRHCRMALMEAGLECAFSEADPALSAKLSPMQRVPFMEVEDQGSTQQLTDSSAILKLIRQQQGKGFLDSVSELNAYCAASTVLDTAINLFYMERDGVNPDSVAYLQRQQSRLHSGLAELNQLALPAQAPYNEAQLRLACLLDWGLFRKRFSLDGHANLQKFLEGIRRYPPFAETVPKG